MAERLANILRAVADRLDPPEPQQPRMAAPRGAYVFDFTTGIVWFDGEPVPMMGARNDG